MAKWGLSIDGQKLFEEHLVINNWSKLSDTKLSEQLRVDRSIATKLRNGNYAGHKSKLESVMIALGIEADEVTSDSFARKYFKEIKPDSHGNPFLPIKGRIENSKQFFNRETELRKIFDFLNAGSGVELLADREMGKSSLLQQIKHRAASALTGQWKAVYLNLQQIHSEAEFYEAFCEELGIDNCAGTDLNRAMRSRRVLLLLDETENLQGHGFTREIRDRLRAFAEGGSLRLVVAAATPLDRLFPDSNEQGMTSPFQGICTRVELKPWQKETVQRFVVTRLENTGISFSETDLEKLWQESQGHPQKLMQACFELYRQYLENL